MRRFWAVLTVLALIVAPCAVTHASQGQSPAGQSPIEAVHNHGAATRVGVAVLMHQASGIGHKSGVAHSSLNGHHHGLGDDGGEQAAHDCLMNCHGWLSAASPDAVHAIQSRKSDVAKSLPRLFAAHQLALPPVAALPQKRMSPHGDPGRLAQISILNETARRRI